jgi:hypothetical protein
LHVAASFWMGVNNCKTDGQRYSITIDDDTVIDPETSMKFPVITLKKKHLKLLPYEKFKSDISKLPFKVSHLRRMLLICFSLGKENNKMDSEGRYGP